MATVAVLVRMATVAVLARMATVAVLARMVPRDVLVRMAEIPPLPKAVTANPLALLVVEAAARGLAGARHTDRGTCVAHVCTQLTMAMR
jgi:hypothetical protein